MAGTWPLYQTPRWGAREEEHEVAGIAARAAALGWDGPEIKRWDSRFKRNPDGTYPRDERGMMIRMSDEEEPEMVWWDVKGNVYTHPSLAEFFRRHGKNWIGH